MASGFWLLVDTLGPLEGLISATLVERTIQQVQDDAQEIKDYAQQNAPWADRSGMARSGLDTDVSEDGGDVVITLFHTVDYGIWLETIQSGAFAIIMPTLETFAHKVFQDVNAKPTGASYA